MIKHKNKTNITRNRRTFKGADMREATVKLLKELGAEEVSQHPNWQTFKLETSACPVNIHPFERWVAMRFENVAQARADFGFLHLLNPYSGKYNFVPGDVSEDVYVTELAMHINRVRS